MAKYRARKKGNGKSWNDIDAKSLAAAQEIHRVSKKAYGAIAAILDQYGANAAKIAIWGIVDGLEAILEQDAHEGVIP